MRTSVRPQESIVRDVAALEGAEWTSNCEKACRSAVGKGGLQSGGGGAMLPKRSPSFKDKGREEGYLYIRKLTQKKYTLGTAIPKALHHGNAKKFVRRHLECPRAHG